MTVGIEVGIHVFFALLSLVTSALLFGILYVRGSKISDNLVKLLSVAVAVLVWLSWLSVINVYTVGYATDRTAIISFPQTALAHELGMEVKEHIFYTGLILATMLPLIAYSINVESPGGRRLLMLIVILIIIGGILMEIIGGWLSIAAKQAWSLKAGGK